MPVYHYTCDKSDEERCKITNLPEEFFEGKDIDIAVNVESRLNIIDEDGNIDADASPLVWFIDHGMFEKINAHCPICKGNARKVMCAVPSYVRGNCYLDKDGCQRDMNIYKLQNDDPYGHMRQPGEKDDMISKLKRGNKNTPQYYYMGRGSKK